LTFWLSKRQNKVYQWMDMEAKVLNDLTEKYIK
jgi:hypothetical protein